MRFNGNNLDELIHTPFIFGPFNANDGLSPVIPGSGKFITTESSIIITTESGVGLSTESQQQGWGDMADEVKISGLPAGTSPGNADIYPMVQSGVTYKVTKLQLFTNINIPPSTNSTTGVISQNAVSLIHTFGFGGNIFVGKNAGNFTAVSSSNQNNVIFGNNGLQDNVDSANMVGVGNSVFGHTTSAAQCVGVGNLALQAAQDNSDCSALGHLSQSQSTAGQGNSSFGSQSLFNLLTGSWNTTLGYRSGYSYIAAESSNICIGNNGVEGDVNVMRLGTTGTSDNQITDAYIAGDRIFMDSGSLSVGFNTIEAGVFSCFLMGGSNEANSGANFSTALGNGNTLQAAQYSTIIGGTNQIIGHTFGLVHGAGNIMGVGGSCAIIAGQNCTINDSPLGASIISSVDGEIESGSNNSVLICSDTGAIDGDWSMIGGTVHFTGDDSFGFGSGTWSANESVILTDRNESYTYTGINQQFIAKFVGGCDLNTFTIDVNGSTTSPAAQYVKTRTVTDTPDTVVDTDYMLSINVGTNVSEQIPAATASGRILIIKDKSGAASSNPITISAVASTIDGAANYEIDTDFGFVTFIDDANGDWSIAQGVKDHGR